MSDEEPPAQPYILIEVLADRTLIVYCQGNSSAFS